MVICLEQGADLHMAQLMFICHCHSLSLASVKSRLVFAFLEPAHPGSPGQRAVKRVCVCVCKTVKRIKVCKWGSHSRLQRTPGLEYMFITGTCCEEKQKKLFEHRIEVCGRCIFWCLCPHHCLANSGTFQDLALGFPGHQTHLPGLSRSWKFYITQFHDFPGGMGTCLKYRRRLFFCCSLILQFSFVENSMHFNLAETENKYLHFTKNIAYHIPEVLISYADKVLGVGHSGNLHVFNFAILLNLQKLDAHEIFMYDSISASVPASLHPHCCLANSRTFQELALTLPAHQTHLPRLSRSWKFYEHNQFQDFP